MNRINCDWCYTLTRSLVEAKFVTLTGRIDTMDVKEYYICSKHADKLCSYTGATRVVIAGHTFDEWILNSITEKARVFHTRRFNQQQADAVMRAARNQGHLPDSVTEPVRWGIRREKWVHRDTGKVRKSLPLH